MKICKSADLIHVVLGVIMRDGQVLVAWRDQRLHQGGRWEFPGGKVEPEESPQQALRRELFEELSVAGTVGELVIRFVHDYDDRSLLLDVHRVRLDPSLPFVERRGRVEWRRLRDLRADEFPPANRPILNALKLPQFYAITPASLLAGARFAGNRLEGYFNSLLETGVRLVVFRAKATVADDYRRLAEQVIECADQAGLQLLLHDFPEEVEKLGAAGVHLSQSGFSRWQDIREVIPPESWFAVSCHDQEELRAAGEAGADFCVLGPVRTTPDHAPALGFAAFEEIVDRARIPVYALGGMHREDVSRARRCGAQGIAGVRCFDLC